MNQLLESSTYTYYLKYDESINGLRDKTHSELKDFLKKTNSSNYTHIYCPCSGKQHPWNSSFVHSHCKSKKHIKWCEVENQAYIQRVGYCPSTEDRMNKALSDYRQSKKLIAQLMPQISDLQAASANQSQEFLKLEQTNEHNVRKNIEITMKFKKILEQKDKQIAELEEHKVYISILQKQIQELEKELTIVLQELSKNKYLLKIKTMPRRSKLTKA